MTMIVYIWAALMTTIVLVVFGVLFYWALVLVDRILNLRESIEIIIDEIVDWWKGRKK